MKPHGDRIVVRDNGKVDHVRAGWTWRQWIAVSIIPLLTIAAAIYELLNISN